MFQFNPSEIKPVLEKELGYSDIEAERFLRHFPELNDELLPALHQWLEDRSVTKNDFYGISIGEIMQIQNENFLLALQEINTILDPTITPDRRGLLIKSLRTPPIYR